MKCTNVNCRSGKINCFFCAGEGSDTQHPCGCTVACNECNGKGSWNCRDCKGTGIIPDKE